jgi:hypothetical protein
VKGAIDDLHPLDDSHNSLSYVMNEALQLLQYEINHQLKKVQPVGGWNLKEEGEKKGRRKKKKKKRRTPPPPITIGNFLFRQYQT